MTIQATILEVLVNDERPTVNLNMATGDFFPDSTLTEYHKSPLGREEDEITFMCKATIVEAFVGEGEDLSEALFKQSSQCIMRHTWKVNQIVGISVTQLNLSEDPSISTQQF